MKKNKLILFCGLLLSLTGCKKLLEIKDTDSIIGDIALKTVANNEAEVLGAYANLSIEMDVLLNATLADEVRVADFYNAATTHEWQYGPADVGLRDNFTAIGPLYAVIDRANRALAALPTATSSGPSDDALKLKLRGEALFLRAFAHFNLFRYYSNSSVGTDLAMPYLDAPNLSLTPLGRITVAPYMTKLKADLAEAKTLVPATLTDVFRANKTAVSGLQARVALYMKEWNDAITYSTEYISALPLSPMNQFAGIWTDANKNESAFILPRNNTVSRMGNIFRGTSAGANNIGTITWRPSDKIWNSYDQTNDVRFAAYFKDEPLIPSTRSSTRLVYKYAGGYYGNATENIANQKVMRTGEMYLIRAEAEAENNDLLGAAVDLNALRSARINGYVGVALATKADAISAIMDERFKELVYEGHRFWDLKRRNLPVQRLTQDAPNAASTTLPAGNYRFLLPIPDPEMKANPSMVQNPGYN